MTKANILTEAARAYTAAILSTEYAMGLAGIGYILTAEAPKGQKNPTEAAIRMTAIKAQRNEALGSLVSAAGEAGLAEDKTLASAYRQDLAFRGRAGTLFIQRGERAEFHSAKAIDA